MNQISNEMVAEYNRIRMRATENLARLEIRARRIERNSWDWLPRTYEVVTKGRIISQEGVTSPQIDVLVLKGAYPKKLLNKKLYLAAGVAAAFECKVTLKASHIAAAMENCTKIKLYRARTGTPYKELHSPLVYGVLAHSHGWKGRASTPEVNIEQKLREVDALHITHPRLQLDLLCIADLAAWTSSKMTFLGPRQIQNWATMVAIYGPNGSATSGYIGFTRTHGQQVIQFTPIGVLISFLSQKLAWEDALLRDLADYYRITNIAGSGVGHMRAWPSSIYSDEIRARVEAGQLSNGKSWDEGAVAF